MSNVACPPLFPPLHGYLECSRPVESANETAAGRLKITNRPGSQCVLQCPTRFGFSAAPNVELNSHFRFIKSYRASGSFIKTCGEDGNWHGDGDGICISESYALMVCPIFTHGNFS